MNNKEFRKTHYYKVLQIMIPILGTYVAWRTTGLWQIAVAMIAFAIVSNGIYYYLETKKKK